VHRKPLVTATEDRPVSTVRMLVNAGAFDDYWIRSALNTTGPGLSRSFAHYTPIGANLCHGTCGQPGK
jgi:hypothetical protein